MFVSCGHRQKMIESDLLAKQQKIEEEMDAGTEG